MEENELAVLLRIAQALERIAVTLERIKKSGIPMP